MQYPCSINVVHHSLKPSLLFLHAPERRFPRLICATASHWDQTMSANWINSMELIVRQISAEIKPHNWWYYHAPTAPDRGTGSDPEWKTRSNKRMLTGIHGWTLLTRVGKGAYWLFATGLKVQSRILQIFKFRIRLFVHNLLEPVYPRKSWLRNFNLLWRSTLFWLRKSRLRVNKYPWS